MNPLSPSNARHLLAAEGWLELSNPQEALAEWEQLDAEGRRHPDSLDVRWQMAAKMGRWNDGVDAGRALIKFAPERVSSWIHCAFALHELKRTEEAYTTLAPVAVRFPAEWVIPYNLACYTAQLGRLPEARDWLAQAFRLGDVRQLKAQAIEDPDLAPLFER